MLRIATVFSGIGAPEEALKQLNVDYNIVFACDNGEIELDKTYEELMLEVAPLSNAERNFHIKSLYQKTGKTNYVKKSYFANHEISEDKWYEDVRFIDGSEYEGKVDIFVGGSPCQSFSTYGKKKGFDDTRGTLFFHYADLVSKIKPKVFIYENVLGLKTHDKGKTWNRIQEVFNELEYSTFSFELNSKDYGLPQNRKRLFVVGFDKDLNITSFDEPEQQELILSAKDYLSESVDNKYYLGKKGFEWVTTPEKHQGRSRVNRDVIGCQTANQQFNWTGDFILETPKSCFHEDNRIYVGEYENKRLVARKMTPLECVKLMGFESFNIVVDDKNMYRQSGNSIAVPVLKAIFKSIFDKIKF